MVYANTKKMARLLLYRIPIWRDPKTENNQPPAFIVELKDISDEVKEKLANVSESKFQSP